MLFKLFELFIFLTLSPGTFAGKDSSSVDDTDGCTIHESNLRLQFLGGYTDPTDSSGDDECYEYRVHYHENGYHDWSYGGKSKKGSKSSSSSSGKNGKSGSTSGSEDESDDSWQDCGVDESSMSDFSVTWSLQLCNNTNVPLSTYLKSVELAGDFDTYQVDDTTFYYTIDNIFEYLGNESNVNTSDNAITLCFHDDNNEDGRNVKYIAKTQYCLDYDGLDDEICSKRGVQVTDVCGLHSAGRDKYGVPPTGIDYVPKPGHKYNMEEEMSKDEEHGGDLMIGDGTFEIRDDLIVVRSWWIDDCKLNYPTQGYMTLVINDDYFNASDWSNLTGTPVVLPLFDHYMVENNDCTHISGVIDDFDHDVDNEQYTFELDFNVSFLEYFDDMSVDISQFKLIPFGEFDSSSGNGTNRTTTTTARPRSTSGVSPPGLAPTEDILDRIELNKHGRMRSLLAEKRRRLRRAEKDEDGEYGDYEPAQLSPGEFGPLTHFQDRAERRRLKNLDFKLTLEFGSLKNDLPLQYKGIEFGKCEMHAKIGFQFKVGLIVEFKRVVSLQKLAFHVILSGFFDARARCQIYESDMLDKKKYSSAKYTLWQETYTPTFGEYGSSGILIELGGIPLIVSPTLDISKYLKVPALGLTFGARANITGELGFEIGWQRGRKPYGFYADWIHDSKHEFHMLDTKYTSKDVSSLAGKLVVELKPKVALSVAQTGFTFVTVGIPFGLPQQTLKFSWNKGSSGERCYEIGLEVNFTAGAELEFGSIDFCPHCPSWASLKFKGPKWNSPRPYFQYRWATAVLGSSECLHDTRRRALGAGSYSSRLLASDDDDDDWQGDLVEIYDNPVTFFINKWSSPFMYVTSPNRDIAVTWYDANEYCASVYGTQLATMDPRTLYYNADDVIEMDDSTSAPSKVWVGLNDIDSEGNWVWNDDEYNPTSLSYTQEWMSGEPSGSGDCVVMDGSDNWQFNDWDCDDSDNVYAFICDYEYQTNENGKYAGVRVYRDALGYDEANDFCFEHFGTALASMHSDSDVRKAYSSVESLLDSYTYAWIGMTNVSEDGTTWDWSDGTQSDDYTKWDDGEPSYAQWGFHTCAQFAPNQDASTTGWDDCPCAYTLYAFVCNLHPGYTQYTMGDQYVGLASGDYEVDWSDAQEVCSERYGGLASINTNSDQTDAESVLTLMNTDSSKTDISEDVWIGLNDQEFEGFYQWSDDTADLWGSVSKPWGPGQPSDSSSSDNEDCVSMRRDWGGDWDDNDCDDDTSTRAMMCNEEYTIYEHENYVGIHSKFSYYTFSEANAFCIDKYGTQLASIHSSTDIDEIEEIAQDLESGTYWIGLTEATRMENDWQWEDGTSVDYQIWYGGLPNNIATSWYDRCGLYLYYDSTSYYYDYYCAHSVRSFICNHHDSFYETENYAAVALSDYADALYWEQANAYCMTKYQGTLATASTYDEYIELGLCMDGLDIYVGLVGYYIVDGEVQSIDGTEVYDFDRYTWADKCVYYYHGSSTDWLSPTDCDHLFKWFICNKGQHDTGTYDDDNTGSWTATIRQNGQTIANSDTTGDQDKSSKTGTQDDDDDKDDGSQNNSNDSGVTSTTYIVIVVCSCLLVIVLIGFVLFKAHQARKKKKNKRTNTTKGDGVEMLEYNPPKIDAVGVEKMQDDEDAAHVQQKVY